ncbi:MAG: hypothetical protein P1Q69_20845 [Candidatus Thorarchaeota archaeon]|nr:hypothetical protein [Candidatus Thorarchaeota archaeon]
MDRLSGLGILLVLVLLFTFSPTSSSFSSNEELDTNETAEIELAATTTTWFLNMSPITISDVLYIESDESLVIHPGVVVEFGASGGIYCEGNIRSMGNATHPITFTSTTCSLDWSGLIYFFHCSRESNFNNCIIEYGDVEAYEGLINIRGSFVRFSNCIFRYNRMWFGVITALDFSR